MAVSLPWLPAVCEKVIFFSVKEKFKYLAVTVHTLGGGGRVSHMKVTRMLLMPHLGLQMATFGLIWGIQDKNLNIISEDKKTIIHFGHLS